MLKFNKEELLEVLPTHIVESKKLTTKQKIVLAQLVMYNGLEQTKTNGFFYRSNKDLCNDCEIQEKTVISSVNKLEVMGFIERKQGKRGVGASEYKINMNTVNDYCKNDNENYSNNYSKQIEEMSLRINNLENTVKSLEDKITVLITVIEGKNYSTDTESDSESDIEKEKEIKNIEYIPENIIKEKEEMKLTVDAWQRGVEVPMTVIDMDSKENNENINNAGDPLTPACEDKKDATPMGDVESVKTGSVKQDSTPTDSLQDSNLRQLQGSTIDDRCSGGQSIHPSKENGSESVSTTPTYEETAQRHINSIVNASNQTRFNAHMQVFKQFILKHSNLTEQDFDTNIKASLRKEWLHKHSVMSVTDYQRFAGT